MLDKDAKLAEKKGVEPISEITDLIKDLNKLLDEIRGSLDCPVTCEPFSTAEKETNKHPYVGICGHTASKGTLDKVAICPECRKQLKGDIKGVKPEKNIALTNVLELLEKAWGVIAKIEKLIKEDASFQQIANLERANQALTAALNQKEKGLIAVQKEFKDFRQEHVNINQKLKALQQQLETIEKENQFLHQADETLRQEHKAEKQQLEERHTRELLESKQGQSKADQTASIKDREINELRSENRKLKAQLTRPEQPLEQSSSAHAAALERQTTPMERKGKGKNKGKQHAAVSQPIASPLLEENPAQQVVAHDAKPLPAKVEPALPRSERNQGSSRRNFFVTALIGVVSVVVGGLIGRFTASSPPPILQGRRGMIVPGSASDLTEPDVFADSLWVHLDLMSKKGSQTIPNLATIIGETLTHEQSSQLIKMLENQQAENIKPEDEAIAEQPDSGVETEDTEALEQQSELADVPDKNEGETTATPSMLPVQAEVDSSISAVTDDVSDMKGSSSESQQERFEKCQKYLTSQDRALIVEGHELLNALSGEGYPPAQFTLGKFMVDAGNAINADGVINSGINLIRLAAYRGDKLAIEYRQLYPSKYIKLDFFDIQNITDITGKEWKGNSHFKKQLKSALKKINDNGLKSDLTEAQNKQTRNEGFKELQDLADLKSYAPAQYYLGNAQLVAGRNLNNEAFIEKGIMYLEKAAAQGVQQAADLLASDPFTKDHSMPRKQEDKSREAKSLPTASALSDVGLFSETAAAQNVAPPSQKLSTKEIADLRVDIRVASYTNPQECHDKMMKLAEQIKIGATVALPEDFSVTTSVPGVMPSLYKPKQTKEWYADTLKYYARMLYTNADLNKGYSYRN